MLNFLYENQPKCESFIPRKLRLDESRILLFGSILSGKTTLGLEFLQNCENSLYIDMSDIRYNVDYNELCEFVKGKNIKALCLDNITKTPEILPNCDRILLISRQKNLEIKGFKKLILKGLDFEEFIAFSKNSDESALFSHFMNAGNSLALNKDESFLRYAILANITKTQSRILSSKAFFDNGNFNALSIFRELKEKIKISKDSFYNELLALENLGIIAFARNFSQNSRLKRVYFCDFALRKIFTMHKNPRKIIENMVFCELAKNGDEVYFLDEFDFYLPKTKTGILVLPFLPSDLAFLKAKKLANDEINEIIIISNAPEQSAIFGSTNARIMSFATFAVGYLDE